MLAKLLTFLPAVGLIGHAFYNAFTLQDFTSAGQDLAQAAVILGIGSAVHSTAAAVKK